MAQPCRSSPLSPPAQTSPIIQPSPGIVNGCAAIHIGGAGISPVHYKQLGLQCLPCLGSHMQRCGALLRMEEVGLGTQGQQAQTRLQVARPHARVQLLQGAECATNVCGAPPLLKLYQVRQLLGLLPAPRARLTLGCQGAQRL